MKNKVLLISYCLFILLIVILADMDRLPLSLISGIPRYDWIAHLLLYGGLYALLLRPSLTLTIFRFRLSLAFVITSSVILLEEFSQLFFESRTFSLADILMGFLGIGIMKLVQKAVKIHQTEQSA